MLEWAKQDAGQTMAEYGFVLTLVAVAVAVTLGVFAGDVSGMITSVVNAF